MSKFTIPLITTLCASLLTGAVAEEPIQVLALLPLTGPAGTAGQYVMNGMTLYTGNHPDSRIALTIEDSQSNPRTALSILSRAVAGRRPDILISAQSRVSGPVIAESGKQNIFTILTLSSSENLVAGHSHVQRMFPPTLDNVTPVAEYAKAQFSRVSILYSQEEFGQSNKDAFTDLYADEHHVIVNEVGFAPRSQEIRTLIDKALRDTPQAVYVSGFDPTYMGLLKGLREAGFEGAILTGTPFCNPQVRQAVGDAAEGILFSGTTVELTDSSAELSKQKETYLQDHGKQMMHFTALSYDLLAVIDDLAQKGESFTQETFTQLGHWPGLAFETTFTGKGECSMPTFLMTQKNGRIERVSP